MKHADVRSALGDIRQSHIFPPAPGDVWKLQARSSKGELTVEHPIWNARRFQLELFAGGIRRRLPDQLEITFCLACVAAHGAAPTPVDAIFQSRQVLGSRGFGYCLRGELEVGDAAGLVTVILRDLGWTAAPDPRAERRVLSISASLDRHFWQHAGLGTRLLTRPHATLFLLTEWQVDEPTVAA